MSHHGNDQIIDAMREDDEAEDGIGHARLTGQENYDREPDGL